MADGGSVTIRAILDASDVTRNAAKVKSELKGVGDGAFDSLEAGAKKAGSALADEADDAAKAGGETEKAGEKAKGSSESHDRLAESAGKAGDALKVGLAAGAAAAGAAVFATAADYDAAQQQIQAALGVSSEEAERFADVGAGIYERGWGDSLQQVTDALIQTKETIRDVDEQGLENVTQNALALEKVFGADVNETIRGTNALMEGFGLSAEEASDLMAAGMQRGLNYTDELGDNLSEYAGRWGEAGTTASQYFSMLEAGTANGAYNLDKVGDFLNEFLTSLSDGRMEENIGRLSEGTQQVFDNFQNGKATAEDVLNAVIGDLSSMTDETERASFASDVWSSLGEDNAMGMILAMGDVEDTFGDVAGTSEQVADSMEQSLGQKAQSAARELAGSLEPLGDGMLNVAGAAADAVGGFAEWFGSLDDGAQVSVAAMAGVAAAAVPAANAVRTVADAARGAKGVVAAAVGAFDGFAEGLGLVGDNADDAGKKSEKASGKIKLADAAMTAAKGAAVGLAVAGLAYVASKFADGIEQAQTFAKATDGLRDAVANAGAATEAEAGSFDAYSGAAGGAAMSMEELVRQQAEWADSLNERHADLGSQLGVIDQYGTVIENLAGKTNLSAEEVAKLESAVDGMNDACGTSLEVAQDAGGAYQVMSDGAALAADEIRDLVDAQKLQAQLDVYQEDYAQALEQEADAAATLAATTDDLNAKKADLNEAYESGMLTYDQYMAQLDELNRQQEAANETYDASADAVDGFAGKMTLAQMAMSGLDGGYAEFVTSSSLLNASLTSNGYSLEDFRDQLEMTGISAEEYQQLSTEELQTLAANYDGTVGSITATMAQFGVDAGWLATDAGQQFASGLTSTSEQALAAAAQVCGVSAGELAKLASDAGLSGSDAIQQFAVGILNGKGPAASAADTAAAAANGELENSAYVAYTWGSHLGGNFADGIASKIDAVMGASKMLAYGVGGILGHSIPKEGPLRVGGRGEAEWGRHLVQNLASGIVEEAPTLKSAAEEAALEIDWSTWSGGFRVAAPRWDGHDGAADGRAAAYVTAPVYSTRGRGDGPRGIVQNFTFNEPVRSPDEVARAVRLSQRYGLAAAE